jgi:ubiquinone/menaquinone biosynthesis C-methylase UbiE
MPPIIRDRRWFYWFVVIGINRNLDMDFKRKALMMSDEEFTAAYERIGAIRSRDSTARQLDFVTKSLAPGTVLEVGAGSGDLSLIMAGAGYQVTATDITTFSVEHLRNRSKSEGIPLDTQIANLECLPFPDASFDNVVCVHTLEHVKDLAASIRELKRVPRGRLVIVVPRERYFQYTANYHLQFFGGPEQLALAIASYPFHCQVIDGALCYWTDLRRSTVSASDEGASQMGSTG